MILVTTATGNIGKELVPRLTRLGLPVRALTRHPDRARLLNGFDKAEICALDPENPETITAAFSGVEKAMLVLPGVPGWEILRGQFFAAAKKAGVKHAIYLSVMGASLSEPAPSMRLHYQGERELEQTGLACTHLRPNCFMQNFSAYYIATINAHSAFYLCAGDTKVAFIDTRDIADAAVRILTSQGHEGKTYDLTGPQALSHHEAAARLSAAIGREVRYVNLSVEDFSQMLLGAGLPAAVVEEWVCIYNRGFFGQGHGARVADSVQMLTGHAARSFDEFARDHSHNFNP